MTQPTRPTFTKEQLDWLKDNLPRGPYERTLGDAVASDNISESQGTPTPQETPPSP